MMPIKINCGCGQRYSFDIEPINGRMPSSVACPVCGADGTSVANAIIAQSAPTHEVPVARLIEPVTASAAADPVAVAPRAAPIRVATTATPSSVAPSTSAPRIAHHEPAAPRPVPRRLPGQLDYDTARNEARAKMLWGDPPQAVLSFLMMQGISRDEASEILNELVTERAKTVRATGFRKIFTGLGCICVPIVTAVIMLMTFIQFQILAVTIMVGVYGFWLLLNGILKVVAPKFEKGDASE
jgi:hypothetical protein